jgi:molecular chaperone DnaK (HSP70)
MAVNFASGKVYGIRNDVNDKMYVGITGQKLNERWYAHKSARVKKATKLCLAMKEIGVEHFEIFLIEDYPTDTLQELMEREKHYINQFNSVENGYNTNVSARTKEERKQHHAIVDKAYAKANKDAIQERLREYYQNNKEKIKENAKKSQERNKEARQDYIKNYNEKNKEKLKEQRRLRYINSSDETKQENNRKTRERRLQAKLQAQP